MASTVFINGITLTDADWFNDLNRVGYDLLDDAATKVAALDALTLRGADIASAATLNLNAATGDAVDVTGSVAITAITLSDGNVRTTRFTGTPVLTNGALLVLPGGANITSVAGDFAIWRGYAAGVVRCVWHSRIGGAISATTLTASGAAALNGGTTTTTLTASGASTLRGGLVVDSVTPSSNVIIDLGNTGGQSTVAALDFHSGATAVDYDVRISSSGGTGANGGGTLEVVGHEAVRGDLTVNRPAAPTTGVIYFGNTSSRYLFYDGAEYQVPGAAFNGSGWRFDVAGKLTSGSVPLARMGTVEVSGTVTVAANTRTSIALTDFSTSHSFYQTSAYHAGGFTVTYGSFVDPNETVREFVHTFITKSFTSTALQISNGDASSRDIVYKVYRLTET